MTKYTKDGPGAPGGQSWTVDWLKFNNAYFKVRHCPEQQHDCLLPPLSRVVFGSGYYTDRPWQGAACEVDTGSLHLRQ